LNAVWRYERAPEKWIVTRSGHPTANWPYMVLSKKHGTIVADNGKGFRTLKDAQEWVERLSIGRAEITIDAPGLPRLEELGTMKARLAKGGRLQSRWRKEHDERRADALVFIGDIPHRGIAYVDRAEPRQWVFGFKLEPLLKKNGIVDIDPEDWFPNMAKAKEAAAAAARRGYERRRGLGLVLKAEAASQPSFMKELPRTYIPVLGRTFWAHGTDANLIEGGDAFAYAVYKKHRGGFQRVRNSKTLHDLSWRVEAERKGDVEATRAMVRGLERKGKL
jgi:hypothetical protein